MVELKKINDIVDIFTDSTAGIFHALKSIASGDSFEWLDNGEYLDIDYYVSHSGEKYASKFYLTMLEHNKDITYIANIIYNRFSEKWKRIYDAMMKEYNPIENYSMVEDENINTNITNTSNGSSNVFGFNTESEDGVSHNKNEVSNTTTGNFNDNHRQLKRAGNIGVTTSQQMLESELEIRKNIFIETVMNDIDSIMCLKIY